MKAKNKTDLKAVQKIATTQRSKAPLNKSSFNKDGSLLLEPTKEGDVPELRIPDAASAYAIIYYHMSNDAMRSVQRSRVRAIVDGNPPYTDKELEEFGLLDTVNVNFKIARKYLDSIQTPIIAVLTGSPLLASIKLRTDGKEYATYPAGLIADAEQVIEEEWDDLLRVDWRDFGYYLGCSAKEQAMFGGGPFAFTNDERMTPVAVQWDGCYVGKAAPASAERLDWFAIRDVVTSTYLYSVCCQKEDAARLGGWVPEMGWATLANARGNTREMTWNRMEKMQEQFRRNDLYWNEDTHDIIVYHIWNKEFDGSVTHSIIPLAQNESVSGGKIKPGKVVPQWGDNRGFLYRSNSKDFQIHEILHPFLTNIGDGSWHSVRGEVDTAFAFLDDYNKQLCQLSTATRMASSVFVSFQNQTSANMAPLVQGAGIVRIPPGVTVAQNQGPNLIQGPIQALAQIRSELNGDWQHIVKQEGKGDAYKPLGVKQQENVQEAQNELTYAALLLNNFGYLMQCMFNRAQTCSDPLAKTFRDRCLARGVPEELLKCPASVYAAGSPQLSSASLQQQTAQQLMNYRGLPQVDDDEITHTLLTQLVGRRRADRIYVSLEKRNGPNPDIWAATMEDGFFRQGFPVPAFEQQDHIIHLKTHLQEMAADVQNWMQVAQQTNNNAQDPQYQQAANMAISMLGTGIPHCGMHAQFAANIPLMKDEAKMLIGRVNSFQNHLKRLQKIMGDAAAAQAKLQQDQAKQQQQGGKLSPKDQADMQIQTMKVQEAQLRIQFENQRMVNEEQRAAREQEIRMVEIQAKAYAAFQGGKQSAPPVVPSGD